MTKLWSILFHAFCNAILSLEAIKYIQAPPLFQNPQHAENDLIFFRHFEVNLNRQKFDFKDYCKQQNQAIVETFNNNS